MIKRKGQYSPETKLTALTLLERNGGNLYRTMKETGISDGTLRRWAKARREGRLLLPPLIPPDPPDETTLDERLEHLAQQMVELMPEKLDEASLQELARSLTIVLATLSQTRATKEKSSHAREKLAEILDRYAVPGSAQGTPETSDGQ